MFIFNGCLSSLTNRRATWLLQTTLKFEQKEARWTDGRRVDDTAFLNRYLTTKNVQHLFKELLLTANNL